jgi:Zn-dependent peptidase ImmA (M78 family)/transcriptional regulator with XRE-family HTH domain
MDKKLDQELGLRIQALRKHRKLTQEQLAKSLGVGSAQIISQIESGNRALKARELSQLADFFKVAPMALMTGNSFEAQPRVSWRDDGRNDRTQRPENEQLFIRRCKNYALIESLAGVGSAVQLPSLPLRLNQSTFEDVEDWAERTEGMLRLGDTPAMSLKNALENTWGIKIFFTNLRGGSAATAKGEFGGAILLATEEPPCRQRFSLAHELFHLLTWDSVCELGRGLSEDEEGRNETLAEVFASRLLLPANSLKPILRKLRASKPVLWIDLIQQARELGVSTLALLWRLYNLKHIPKSVIDDFKEKPALAELDRRFKHKPEPSISDLPLRYVHLAFRCHMEGKISTAKMAELMETTVGALPRVLAEYELDLDADAYETTVISA